MNAIVIYESVYGNTRAIAEAIAEGLGAQAMTTDEAPGHAFLADLLVVGGPTHMHGMPTARSLRASPEESTPSGPALRDWLADLPQTSGARAAAFDTRFGKAVWLTGAASRGIAKRLDRLGYTVVETASFLVADGEGPLVDGELERARRWGEELAASLSVTMPGAELVT
jgi:flavodoxin